MLFAADLAQWFGRWATPPLPSPFFPALPAPFLSPSLPVPSPEILPFPPSPSSLSLPFYLPFPFLSPKVS